MTRDPLAPLGLDAWPDAPEHRALLTRGTRGGTRVALLSWAHAAAGAPPTMRQWAAMLGITCAALRSMRHELAVTLAVASEPRAPRDPSTLAPSSVRRRRCEARARGESVPLLRQRKTKRRRKTAAS